MVAETTDNKHGRGFLEVPNEADDEKSQSKKEEFRQKLANVRTASSRDQALEAGKLLEKHFLSSGLNAKEAERKVQFFLNENPVMSASSELARNKVTQ